MQSLKAAVFNFIGTITVMCVATNPSSAGPSAQGFVCGSADGAPATNAVTSGGRHIPIIRWTSSIFNDAGWNQQRRCKEVSSRFDTFLKKGQLDYITTGRINGLPVICTTDRKGGSCIGLLYTLKPYQNADATLKELLDIRVKARGPLNETNARLYVSLDELLSTAQTNFNNGVGTSSGTIEAQPGKGLF